MLTHTLPNEVPLASPQPTDLQWWGDASTSFGVRIALGCYWAMWKWVPGFEVGPLKHFNIGWAEAVAVELGLRIAIHLHLLENADPSRQVFLVRSGNSGVVAVTNKGCAWSKETNRTLKHIFLLQAQHCVQLKAVHVPGQTNTSDALSQGDINGFLHGFPSITTQASMIHPSVHTPLQQASIIVRLILVSPPAGPSSGYAAPLVSTSTSLQLAPSPLRPNCRSEEQIFQWRGVNLPPATTIDDPTICLIAAVTTHASLHETSSYGSGLYTFHLFCDIFSVPEMQHLLASFEVLHSFALWAATDPGMLRPGLTDSTLFEPISVSVVHKYLSAIRAWHLTQGWPLPLTDTDHDRINWSLQGLTNAQGLRRHPICPLITL